MYRIINDTKLIDFTVCGSWEDSAIGCCPVQYICFCSAFSVVNMFSTSALSSHHRGVVCLTSCIQKEKQTKKPSPFLNHQRSTQNIKKGQELWLWRLRSGLSSQKTEEMPWGQVTASIVC